MYDNTLADKVLIIDFGSQFTMLIARRIRDLGVYSEVINYRSDIDKIKAHNPKAIILSGGPMSVTEKDAPDIDLEIFELGIPILGICYGQQLMCHKLGGRVSSSELREYGPAMLHIEKDSEIFGSFWNLGDSHRVWMSHGDRVEALPVGFEVLATTRDAPYAMIEYKEKRIYGVQFHPEVTHTNHGKDLIKQFVIDIAHCQNNWNMHNFLEKKMNELRERIADDTVICAVSGGVDSTVVATLLHRAIKDRVKCIFVDTGLLRKGEAEIVQDFFKNRLGIDLITIDASTKFLLRLAGVTEPEEKRKIIGSTFIDVFQEAAKDFENVRYLAQGTLYSDVVESSVGGSGHTIKSHHNVGGLPAHLNLELIEPVRDIFKDEVRLLGKELNIPQDFIDRHPFPGPGLAIRIIGEVTEKRLQILREVDAIFIEELKSLDLYNHIWQAFAILLPIQTVGVMGDGRTYESVVALRAVNSSDGMTASVYHFDMNDLTIIANKIVNQVKGVNRVVYDITTKPPATIEWE